MASPPPIDLRSDTVTKPTQGMMEAMLQAQVGDDVIGDDPSVKNLQDTVAALLGKEAALFVPSGTMANQLAVNVHCQQGDEILCERDSHLYNYEQAGYAQFTGATVHTLSGRFGVLGLEQIHNQVRQWDDHMPRTRMIALENTHNRGGGTVQPIENVDAICGWAHQQGLVAHLDGARLFNAAVALGVEPNELTRGFDSVSVCFSKGLGAPVGSALVGSQEFITRARRARKAFGGGMRQLGFMAAAAHYAVENHRERLAEDHEHAQLLAEAVAKAGFELEPKPQTNILIFRVPAERGLSSEVVQQLAQKDILCFPFGPEHVRFVTHLDVCREQIEAACQRIEHLA